MIDYEKLNLWLEEQLHPIKEPLGEPKEKFCGISGVKLDALRRSIICALCGMAGYENNTTYFGGNPSCKHAFVLNEDEECDHERLTVGCKVCDSYKLDPNNPAYLTEECRHESDGTATALLSNSPKYQFKCLKCGEFYK